MRLIREIMRLIAIKKCNRCPALIYIYIQELMWNFFYIKRWTESFSIDSLNKHRKPAMKRFLSKQWDAVSLKTGLTFLLLWLQLHCCGLFSYMDWEDNIPDTCLCDQGEEMEGMCQSVSYQVTNKQTNASSTVGSSKGGVLTPFFFCGFPSGHPDAEEVRLHQGEWSHQLNLMMIIIFSSSKQVNNVTSSPDLLPRHPALRPAVVQRHDRSHLHARRPGGENSSLSSYLN